MEREYDDDATSVGTAIAASRAYTTQHPYYNLFSQAVDEKVADLSARRGGARAASRPVAVTVALDVGELADVSEAYPEFTLVNYGSARPAHAWWVQHKRLANEWLLSQAMRYGKKVAHCGGTPLSYLLSTLPDAVFLSDPANVVAVHERHAAGMDVYALMKNYRALGNDLGIEVDRRKYEAFLRKEVFKTHIPTMPLPESDVLCVDGVTYAYGPAQVAAMMMQSGAALAFGFFVYHPSMLLSDDGEIPGTGVFFSKTASGLTLQYPEGVAGATRYRDGVWESWLTSHNFSLGRNKGKVWFQLELLKNRGHLMFYRVTKVPEEPSVSRISHALEIDGAENAYLVHSWELKALGMSPNDQSNWQYVPRIVSRRLVDRVREMALQLPAEQFTRYAVRKQIIVTNDRVILEGTSVKVNSPIGLDILASMTIAIYSSVFVERYASGQLTKEMFNTVKDLAAFSTSSTMRKVWIITRVCLLSAWDYTFGYVDSVLRVVADWIRDSVSRSAAVSVGQVQELAPYVLLTGAVKTWLSAGDGVGLLQRLCDQTLKASIGASGFSATWATALCTLSRVQPEMKRLELHRFRMEYSSAFEMNAGSRTSDADKLVDAVKSLNVMDEEPADRRSIEMQQAVRMALFGDTVHFEEDADPVWSLNQFYAAVNPGVGMQNLEYDTASISLDPQDRTLAAPYLKLPRYFGDPPVSKSYYRSKLVALNVPKRQGTLQELLSSMAARNMNAPQVSLPQDDLETAVDIWDTFLDNACIPGAREMLRRYQADPVALAEDSLRDWAAQSTPNKVKMAVAELEKESEALGEMPVNEYLVMLKSEVKPTLSTKPLDSRTEPQVIVYHKKALSALYSSIFRVLVRRFLSLLRPNYHVNLLKDMTDVRNFIQSVHPFGADVKYLENDFSKYDKSQGHFAFFLEEYVFTQLGMDSDMLNKWVGGHVECSMRALAMGMSLHVMYQRKSGDATTAFGNVILNILSVTYAYKGTDVIWAGFMGDDSIVCASMVVAADSAAQILAEVFNLGAKTFLTDAPYYASNFILIDDINERVAMVPDPFKLVEKFSMAVAADDPQWRERFVSAADSKKPFLNVLNTAGLARAVSQRYPVDYHDVVAVAGAVATLVSNEKKFRSLWEDKPEQSNY